jgi:hypothetical protein
MACPDAATAVPIVTAAVAIPHALASHSPKDIGRQPRRSFDPWERQNTAGRYGLGTSPAT